MSGIVAPKDSLITLSNDPYQNKHLRNFISESLRSPIKAISIYSSFIFMFSKKIPELTKSKLRTLTKLFSRTWSIGSTPFSCSLKSFISLISTTSILSHNNVSLNNFIIHPLSPRPPAPFSFTLSYSQNFITELIVNDTSNYRLNHNSAFVQLLLQSLASFTPIKENPDLSMVLYKVNREQNVKLLCEHGFYRQAFKVATEGEDGR